MSDLKNKQLVCFFCRHHNPAANIFCQNCDKILTPNTDYFSKFGYPISFDINISDCKNKYLDMQSKVHPDLFVKKSEIEQTLALNFASYLNDAYKTLKDEYLRSKYILKLNNIDLDNNPNQYFKNSNEFLHEIMDITEAQEEAANDDEINQIDNEINAKISQTLLEIANDFKEEDYLKAAIDTIKLSYYQKVRKK
ncbi:MAG: Fe-S protein assembly co-chaperone HscB [Rickettsiales bacterium]|nr:Fe-S protein assembly co-chaperone HscB [Rickettsiales bacterium]